MTWPERFERASMSWQKKWRLPDSVRERLSVCIKVKKAPTFDLGLDKVEHLAEAVLEGKGLNRHGLQLLTLLLVEVLQLVHAEHPVPVQVHAAEPVLYTGTQIKGKGAAGSGATG